MNNPKIKTSFVRHLGVNKTGLNITIFHFNIRGNIRIYHQTLRNKACEILKIIHLSYDLKQIPISLKNSPLTRIVGCVVYVHISSCFVKFIKKNILSVNKVSEQGRAIFLY